MKPMFRLGKVKVCDNVVAAYKSNFGSLFISSLDDEEMNELFADLLVRHTSGDFGHVDDEQINANMKSIEDEGGDVISIYEIFVDVFVEVFTDLDASQTRISLN